MKAILPVAVFGVLLHSGAAMAQDAFTFASADNEYQVSLHGYAQLDSRNFPGNNGDDEWLMRRIRPIIEAKADNFSFRLMPDLAQTASAHIAEVRADYTFDPMFSLRAGKFKPPLGLERLQSSADMPFIERGQPSNLTPISDLGFMAYGDIIPHMLEYQVGLFSGVADRTAEDIYGGDSWGGLHDVDMRIFAHPVKELGIGIAGSIGDHSGSLDTPQLGNDKTSGQQTFFKYASGTYADGLGWRLLPQATWDSGSLGLLAEYTFSSQEVTRGSDHAQIDNNAWQLVANYALTGEQETASGDIKPLHPLSLQDGGAGAWEAVARMGATYMDNAAFANFADPARSARRAESGGVGLNWYPNEYIKFMLDYDITEFDGGAAGGNDRPDEQALFGRLQLRF